MRPWLSWIERRTTNPDVGGSNPPGRTSKNKGLQVFTALVTPYFLMIVITVLISGIIVKRGRQPA